MLNISAIPALADNYIWLLQESRSSLASLVDPGDAQPVLQRLRRENLQLAAIFITHHHGDHVGGIRQLVAAYPDVEVFGPMQENIPGMTHPLREGDKVKIPGTGIDLQVLDVPGHTHGHIAYYGANALFCGDTLFACGCGRLFEGTPEQMQTSLSKFLTLPNETDVYCAHEYTLDNIQFAKWVEPNNPILLQRELDDQARIDADQATVPSKLSLEKQTNPFLRFTEAEVITVAEQKAGRRLNSPTEVFTVIRHWKDNEFDCRK